MFRNDLEQVKERVDVDMQKALDGMREYEDMV